MGGTTTSSYGPKTKMERPRVGACLSRMAAAPLGTDGSSTTFLTLWQYSQLTPSHSVRREFRTSFKSKDQRLAAAAEGAWQVAQLPLLRGLSRR